MSIEDIAKDIVLEIVYGCDRLDRDDLKEYVVAEGWDINQVKEIITMVVFKELGGRMESEAHLERQLEYWFKDL